MKNTTERQRRDAMFIARCAATLRRLEENGMTPRPLHVVTLALNSEAPEFYVSEEYAIRRVREMAVKLADPHDMSLNARRMRCIFRRVVDERIRDPKLTVAEAVRLVLQKGKAPQFYISDAYGLWLFNRHFRRTVSYRPIPKTESPWAV